LYTLAKVARIGVEQVVNLLKIANNDLPVVKHRYERSKRDLDSIEAEKHNSARILQEISDQILYLRKIYKEQSLELTKLQIQKVRLQGLVDNFQNNDEELLKIRNTVEEKVHSVLSDRRMLLKLALFSLPESIRKDPDKYSPLIYNISSSSTTSVTADYNGQYHAASYGQQQYTSQDYIDVLLDEADNLFNKLSKEIADENITAYTFSISSSPLLAPSNEGQQPWPTKRLPDAEESCQS
jgi:hypothetical protein